MNNEPPGKKQSSIVDHFNSSWTGSRGGCTRLASCFCLSCSVQTLQCHQCHQTVSVVSLLHPFAFCSLNVLSPPGGAHAWVWKELDVKKISEARVNHHPPCGAIMVFFKKPVWQQWRKHRWSHCFFSILPIWPGNPAIFRCLVVRKPGACCMEKNRSLSNVSSFWRKSLFLGRVRWSYIGRKGRPLCPLPL